MLTISAEEKIGLLERNNVRDRVQKLVEIVTRELELQEISSRIQSQVADEVGKTQRQYYLREQMKAIQRELGEEDDRQAEIDELKQEDRSREDARGGEARRRRRSSIGCPRCRRRPRSTRLADVSRLAREPPMVDRDRGQAGRPGSQVVLDEDHFDLEKVKDRILEYLAVRSLKKDLKGPILCFAGPPGVGKTSLGRSIARAMGRKFVRMSLGGVRDEAEIRGHRRTYIGSLPGRIIQGIKRAGTRNPVFVLDEIDKVGTDFRGDPSSALLEVLDPEQNACVLGPLSRGAVRSQSSVFFICTANVLDTIPPALRDRMEVLRLPGYTEEEKVEIAKTHIVPRQLEEHGLTDSHIEVTDDAIRTLINDYTREAGVRNLDREIANDPSQGGAAARRGPRGPRRRRCGQGPRASRSGAVLPRAVRAHRSQRCGDRSGLDPGRR